jgi:peptidoglycan/LPS O-acetylase OafA/YrhL
MEMPLGHLSAAQGQARAYRADIDGLRAVAVTAVVLFHAGVPWLAGGFAGVDIFFVISGFLIGGIVDAETRGGTFRFAAFYARRARRILPALLTVCTATAALGMVLLAPAELRRLAQGIAAALIGGSNVWFWHAAGYFSPDARAEPMLMTWSLGIEEQFYVCLPPLMMLLRRFGERAMAGGIAALTAASLLLSVLATPAYPHDAFYLLPTRAWELGAGVLLALWFAARPLPRGRVAEGLGWAGAAMIAATLLLVDEHVAFPGHAALLPVLGTAALIAGGRGRLARRVLSARPMVAVGLLSYSWYLWHWPLMALARICAAKAPPLALSLAIAAVSLALAWASWRWVERAFRRPGGSDAVTLWRYGGVLAVALALCALTIVEGGWPARLPPAAARTAAQLAGGTGGACLAGYEADRPNLTGDCVMAGSAPGVALIGDSHAAALRPALLAQAQARRARFVQLTKASCPPLFGATRAMPNHPGHAEACARYDAAAVAAVTSDPGVATVVVTGFWQVSLDPQVLATGERYVSADDPRADSAAALRSGLVALLRRLRAAGKQVVLLADVPSFRFDPARLRYADYLPLRRTVGALADPSLRARDGWVARAQVAALDDAGAAIVRQAAAAVPGVAVASLAAPFCDAARCRIGDASAPWFVDPQHVSPAGAKAALAPVTPLIWSGAARR